MKELATLHADQNGLAFGANRTPRTTSFGEFVVGVYDSSDEPGAGAMVSLALAIGLLVFSEPELSDDLPEFARKTRHENESDKAEAPGLEFKAIGSALPKAAPAVD